MSTSAMFSQISAFLNIGEINNIYTEASQVGKSLNLTADESEFHLETIFNVPPALEKLAKTSVPEVITISCDRYVENRKEDGSKGKRDWRTFRQQCENNRRIVKMLEKILAEDPEEESLALQNAWERSGAKETYGSSADWGEEPTYFLPTNLVGLWASSDSAVWAPKKNEIGFEAFDWSEDGSCISSDTAYGSCVSDSASSAYGTANQSFCFS